MKESNPMIEDTATATIVALVRVHPRSLDECLLHVMVGVESEETLGPVKKSGKCLNVYPQRATYPKPLVEVRPSCAHGLYESKLLLNDKTKWEVNVNVKSNQVKLDIK